MGGKTTLDNNERDQTPQVGKPSISRGEEEEKY